MTTTYASTLVNILKNAKAVSEEDLKQALAFEKTSGKKLYMHDAIETSIKLCMLSSDFIRFVLPYPHNLEYEKTMCPFIIISKKTRIDKKHIY